MKFNKNNLVHWRYLIKSILVYLLVLPIAYLSRRKEKKIVILYGHKFNGNLWAFYQQKLKDNKNYSTFYLSMDKLYVNELCTQGFPALWTGNLSDMIKVACASAIITDHHPQLNFLFFSQSQIKFIDVWHGIPYKGYLESDFDYLKRYDQVWTNSSYMANFYINKHHFPKSKIKITGYGRVDGLINQWFSKNSVLEKYCIEGFSKYVIIAPTWKQDEKKRSILPFGLNEIDFVKTLNNFGKKHNTLFIIRAHLNANQDMGYSMSNVKIMPYKEYPIAEEFLYISDILITDWSSIAFDYFVLNRPAIFLNVNPPFANGFTYKPEFRYGPIVNSLDSMLSTIEKYLIYPEEYINTFSNCRVAAQKVVFGGTDDGKSLDRYMNNLLELTKND